MKRLILILAALLLIVAYPTLAQLGVHGLTRLFPRPYADLMMADMPEKSGGMQVPDGAITYCADCAVPAHPGDKCAAGGPGAEAHRIRGQWSCF
jgi:hypothetical protein